MYGSRRNSEHLINSTCEKYSKVSHENLTELFPTELSSEDDHMRIALVTPRFHPSFGGVETHVGELASALIQEGNDVDVFTPNHTGKLESIECIDGVTVRRFRQLFPTENFAISPGISRELRKRKDEYDIVHLHSYHATAAALAAAVWNGPIVFTPHYHGTGHTRFRAALHLPYRLIGRWLFDKSSAVIAVSAGEADQLRIDVPSIADRISIISNGVSLEALTLAEPFYSIDSCLPDGAIVVLCSGRLETYKRIDRVIAAVEALMSPYHLIITGDGPARQRLESIIEVSPAKDRIHVLGRVSPDDLHRWRATAHVFVTLSEHEAQSVVLLEALAAGKPCLASDIAAHRSVAELSPETVQLLGAHESASEIATRIAGSLGRGGSTTLVPSWSTVARDVIDVYRLFLPESLDPTKPTSTNNPMHVPPLGQIQMSAQV